MFSIQWRLALVIALMMPVFFAAVWKCRRSMFVSDKLASIDSVLSTATYFILRKYKDHGTVLVKQPKAERMLVTP